MLVFFGILPLFEEILLPYHLESADPTIPGSCATDKFGEVHPSLLNRQHKREVCVPQCCAVSGQGG